MPALFSRTWLLLACLILGAMSGEVSWAGPSGNPPAARPFQVGEKLTYEISWLKITAGTAVMAVSAAGTDGDRPLVKLVTTAKSRSAITKFFPVDNRVESILDPATLLPEHLTFRRREGKKKEDIEYTFHQKEGTVTVVKSGPAETLQIPPGTQDVISCLYYARSQLSLQPGSSLTMNVHHDKKNYKLDVRVEAIETISSSWGKVETARVLVVMPFQGLFLNQGNIRVWFTNDDRRIPVRMKAKVIIGSIVADLAALPTQWGASRSLPTLCKTVILASTMGQFPLTLSRFIAQKQAVHPGATVELTGLLAQIGLVGKLIAQDLRRAGLSNILGTTGEINVQGEAVKKLDEIANETFLKAFHHSGLVCALASEEMEKPVLLPEYWPQAKYMLLFDPLDGSSNTDCNMPLGSIFSVVKFESKDRMPTMDDLVRNGTEQVAAGYLLYGSSTMLVYTVGQGVHGFTLESGIGEYLLSHEQIRIPARGKVYGTNEGNYYKWTTGTKKYMEYLKAPNRATGRPYSGRYSGCLVADVHRILLGGGIYLYPGELDKPEGKLRLLYEANPLALVVEQAGGRAGTGTMRLLDVEAKQLHQRVPVIIGSADDVLDAEAFIQGRR